MRQLFEELGLDLMAVLETAIERLRVEPFGDRIARAGKEAGS